MADHDEPKAYLVERIHQALATDPRVNALDIEVRVRGGQVFLSGIVTTEERRDAVSEVAREYAPGLQIHNETTVADLSEAERAEELT